MQTRAPTDHLDLLRETGEWAALLAGSADIQAFLDRIVRRVADNHRVPLTYDDAVVKLIAERCAEVESGARVVDAILTNTVLPAISREMLNRTLEGKTVPRVTIGVGDTGFSYGFD
jgi:type VI secretion system protein VasG